MIPPIIHYCWLSNDPLPDEFAFYLNKWKEILKGYEFILWNFNKFDINKSVWVKEAFESGKYAFAADYIRLYALYEYGGIYLDLDVEVLKRFDDFLHLPTMVCYENSKDKRLEMATIGTEKHSSWVKLCLDYYENKHFINAKGEQETKVLPCVIRDVLKENKYSFVEIEKPKEYFNINDIKKGIPILPYTYFSPKSYGSGKIFRSENTYSIHHFSGSWLPWYAKLEKKLFQFIGLSYHDVLRRIFALINKRKL